MSNEYQDLFDKHLNKKTMDYEKLRNDKRECQEQVLKAIEKLEKEWPELIFTIVTSKDKMVRRSKHSVFVHVNDPRL